MSKIRDERGFSLTELLVVLVIIGILAAFALMQRGSADEQLKRQNVARELKVAIERARFDSVKRRANTTGEQAKVVVTPTGYTVTTYQFDGTSMVASDVARDLTSQNVVIDSTLTIYFNKRGEVVDSGGASISPVFTVCNVSCSSPTSANSNIVLVTPTGTVNLLAGGSTIPTFSPPPITNVNPGTGISNTIVVP